MTDSSQPILRWLGTWSPYGKPSSPEPSPSSSSANLSSPNPSLVSLKEAFTEPLNFSLPRRPPSVQLSQHSLTRHPPFLDNLTRSTLPTASLSPPSIVSSTTASASPTSPTFRSRSNARSNNGVESPTISLNQSPPTRTSLDSLRSVSHRDLRRTHSRAASTASALPTSDSTDSNVSWWWFQSGNKDKVDSLLEEEDRAATVQEERDNIRKKYQSPRNPVVFCHGLLGFDSVTIGPSIAPMQVMHWRGIKEVLEANGTEVLITRVPATSSPVDRAIVLEEKISEVYPGKSVHLIGHSMGGIDCRYLTTHLTKRKFNVLSITTIATPHRGSAFADHFLTTLGKGRMDSFLSLIDLLPNGGGDGKAFECLTLDAMATFNENVPDVEGVKYFSWGATYNPGFVDTWKWPHSVVLEKEGPNDGLVSVESAKWGKYMGTIENVNHLDLVGWINPARFKWAEMVGRTINFRPATFYLGIADMIARAVDGVDDPTEEDQAGKGARVRSPSLDSAQPKPDERVRQGEESVPESTRRGTDSPGPTEMSFAADAGEVIDKVVLRADPSSTSTDSHYSEVVSQPPSETPPSKVSNQSSIGSR